MFVLHEHHKPQHHFDLRLEEDGVLRSWAVPEGDANRLAQGDRLAVAVGDHDLDHATYTDATKAIADTGWWELEDRNDRRFVFVLHGRDGARRYALIDTGTDWLLHLTKAQPPAALSPDSPRRFGSRNRPFSRPKRRGLPTEGHGQSRSTT